MNAFIKTCHQIVERDKMMSSKFGYHCTEVSPEIMLKCGFKTGKCCFTEINWLIDGDMLSRNRIVDVIESKIAR